MDLTLYWFMLPVAVVVSTAGMLSGIGGAALFTPLFLVGFPLLGSEYVLTSPVAAIGVALLTQTLGFSSGLIGYLRRRLIDFETALPFLAVSVPAAVLGATLTAHLPGELIKGAYGALVLVIAAIMYRQDVPLGAPPGDSNSGHRIAARMREITDDRGRRYRYEKPRQGRGVAATGLGGFFTGMLSAGIGEVVMPQLAKRNRVPIAVAAATSVFIVIVTIACACFTHIATLLREGGLEAVPWHLVIYTVPGVIIGGQIGPQLQGRIAQRPMERAIALLFALIGLAMWAAVLFGARPGAA